MQERKKTYAFSVNQGGYLYIVVHIQRETDCICIVVKGFEKFNVLFNKYILIF